MKNRVTTFRKSSLQEVKSLLHPQILRWPPDLLQHGGSDWWSSGPWASKPCSSYLCLLGRSMSWRNPGGKTMRRGPVAPTQAPDAWVRPPKTMYYPTRADCSCRSEPGWAQPTQSTHWVVRNGSFLKPLSSRIEHYIDRSENTWGGGRFIYLTIIYCGPPSTKYIIPGVGFCSLLNKRGEASSLAGEKTDNKQVNC